MTNMLMITLAMLVVRLIATPSEATLTGDVTSEAMTCISQCPLDPKSMSPSYVCVIKNCYKQLAKCAFDWTCRKTLSCETKCTGQLAGVDGSEKFVNVQGCLNGNCPGFPPNVGCIEKNCKMVAAECALNGKCRHALECANKCTPSIADVGLARPEEDDEELMATDDANTTSEAMTCVSQCPLDAVTMAPSYSCVIRKCFMKVGKCLVNSSCRNLLRCVGKCPKPLAHTTAALRLIEGNACVTERCPGYPASNLCLATRCTKEAANCGMQAGCRTFISCANKCSSGEDLTITV